MVERLQLSNTLAHWSSLLHSGHCGSLSPRQLTLIPLSLYILTTPPLKRGAWVSTSLGLTCDNVDQSNTAEVRPCVSTSTFPALRGLQCLHPDSWIPELSGNKSRLLCCREAMWKRSGWICGVRKPPRTSSPGESFED